MAILRQDTIIRWQSTAQAASGEAPVQTYDEIPSPKGLPILKNMMLMMNKDNVKNFMKFAAENRKELGDTFKLRMPGKGNDIVFICNPADARTLLSNEGETPQQPAFERAAHLRRNELADIFKTAGLFGSGKDWAENRKAVQQDMMRPSSALFYIDELAATSEELCDKLIAECDENGETVKFNYTLQQFALEAVGIMFIATKLGVMQGAPDGQRLMAVVSAFVEKFNAFVILPKPVLKMNGIWKHMEVHTREIFNIAEEKVQEAIRKDDKDGSLKGSILGKLLDRCGRDSPIPIVTSVDSLSAGIDTTAHTLTFLLYHLATNPEKQEALYKEIVSVTGPQGKITQANLSSMKYLKACQTESQRLWPIANSTARRTEKELVLGGYKIPAGTFVLKMGLNSTDEEYYPNPLEFRPERWLRDSPDYRNVDRYTNLPFGHGPRSCIGQRFARLELYMATFRMVQRFKMEYHHEPIDIDYTGFGHPDREVRIRLIPRF